MTPQRRARSHRSAFLSLLALALAAALLGPPSAPSAAAAGDDHAEERASAVLERVRTLLNSPGKAAHRTPGPDADQVTGRGLTMALRDLALVRDDLSGSEKKEAGRILSRPTDVDDDPGTTTYPAWANPKKVCNARACVHYMTHSRHGTTKAFAETTLRFALRSYRRFVDHKGYRPPMPDGGKGGNNLLDIYLADTEGFFGYTANDAKTWGDHERVPGYLVLDHDFRNFCSNTCSDRMVTRLQKVTVAHEYYHAVQFGYDFGEDAWFMEATATWAEDLVFDGVNDNVNYLYYPKNVMTHPRKPIDSRYSQWYGNWIFFRYFSERYNDAIVRQMWQRADAGNGWDQYSLQAVRNTVNGRGGNWNNLIRRFYDHNRRPGRFYSEAKEANYPHAPKRAGFSLTKDRRRLQRETKINHLGGVSYRFQPGRDLRRRWELRVRIDAHSAARGGTAIAAIKKAGGGFNRVAFNLGGDGRKARTLGFGRDRVKWVEITLVNASTRYRCDVYPVDPQESYRAYNTCQGRALDNRKPFTVTVRARRR